MTPAQLSIAFFLQMAVIIATCRAVGWLAQRFMGQPQVVVEMIDIVPRFLRTLGKTWMRDGGLSDTRLAITLMLFLLAAWAMDTAGMHAVFGGLLCGTAILIASPLFELSRRKT